MSSARKVGAIGGEDNDLDTADVGVMHSARSVGTSGGENEDQNIADAGVKYSARSAGTSAGKILNPPFEGPSPHSESPHASQQSLSAEEMRAIAKAKRKAHLCQTLVEPD